jgi:death-on-curing protein
MININEILFIHKRQIQEFGGGYGIRSFEAIESAINRPFATFGGQELYPSPIDKAAAIGESIINNHPFIDGNKRTGYGAMLMILNNSGIKINATKNEKYDFVIDIASGKKKFEDIKDWLEKNTVSIS